jgi:hypothetical protein
VNPHQTQKENIMITTRTRAVVLIGAFLYVSATAFAGGVAAEGIRFDRQRAVVLQRHDEAVQQWHQFLMAAEQRKVEAGSAAGAAVQVVW